MRKSRMSPVRAIAYYLVALFFLALFGFPLVLTILMSLKSLPEYMSGNYWTWPRVLYLGNYAKVLFSDFNRYFLNSFFVSAIAVSLTALLGSMAGYAFAKLKFRFSGPLLLLFMVGMMIPVHTTLIPIYQLSRLFHSTDKLLGLVGPYIGFGLPMAIYILTYFFRDVPNSIQESAVIDGASPYRIYRSIMLPMSVPAISTVAIVNFLADWNEFIFALTLINTNAKKTLPLGMREFYGAETINIPAVLAAVLIGSLPVIIFYLFAQEKVINGLSAGAIKG